MSGFKFLIDTNVIIGLEDPQLVEGSFAELVRTSSANNIRIFIDRASYQDVERDTNVGRKAITLSKLAKFERLGDIPQPPDNELVARYGPITNDNDKSDIRLLIALESRAVDFLITQDNGIHKRAEKRGVAASVFTVEEAVEWLRQTFTPAAVELPFVVSRKAYEIDRGLPLFASIAADYSNFSGWFEEKCVNEHRDCWVLQVGNNVAGIVIRKDESHSEAGTVHTGPKILKICTLKVDDAFRGEKFGELLIKQILWFAQKNAYNLTYLTLFPKQRFLMELLSAYGFDTTHERPNGEIVLEKAIFVGALPPPNSGSSLFASQKFVYPRFLDGEGVKKFCIPIKPDYHRRLFPEIAFMAPTPMFPNRMLMAGVEASRIPGNTIRKVYLCRAKAKKLKSGDLIFFYMSRNDGFLASQSLTTVGVVEQVQEAASVDQLILLTAKRSVYSQEELANIMSESTTPVKVIDFLLTGHFDKPIDLATLTARGIFGAHPPQSIAEIDQQKYQELKQLLRLGYEI